MILHVLGGGPAQVNLIKRIIKMGHKAAVSDMNPAAPGLALADYPSPASSFDTDAVKKAASEAGSQRILTLGTDQPVLTAALVSEELNLPFFLTGEQAEMVTNKKVMKMMFAKKSIPTADFRLLAPGFSDEELAGLGFPLVIKPLDSQGQRGVLKVHSPSEIREHMAEVLSFSRQKEILAEEFYPGDEVTISGWVYRGQPHIFSITDRVTVENDPYLGVCVSHRYPSVFHDKWKELESLTGRICRAVGLKDGPLYFQILGGKQGFKVNEIACRLGGAYEDEFLPALCGADPLSLLIEQTLSEDYNWMNPESMTQCRKGQFFSLQMFFCRPGVISSRTGMSEASSLSGFGAGRFLLPCGTVIRNRENSTQRAGYFFVTAGSPQDLNDKINRVYDFLSIKDQKGREMIERTERMYFPP